MESKAVLFYFCVAHLTEQRIEVKMRNLSEFGISETGRSGF